MTTDQREVDKAHESLDAAGTPRALSGSPIRLFSRIEWLRHKHVERLLELNSSDKDIRARLESVAESTGPCKACQHDPEGKAHLCNHSILRRCIRDLTQRWNWKKYREHSDD